MRVLIKPPSALEAKAIEQKDATPGFGVEPIFYESRGKAIAAFIEIQGDDNNTLFRGLLTVNGRTGGVDIIPRTRPVKAEIDVPKKASKK